MYYVKSPLRHLCEPQELMVSEDQRDEAWNRRVNSLLSDLRAGLIPQWAVSVHDLDALTVQRDDEDQPQ